MTPEQRVAAVAPLTALVTRITGAEVRLEPKGYMCWKGGQPYDDEPFMLTVDSEDGSLLDVLLHELCHWACATTDMRTEYNLGLYSNFHSQWPSYSKIPRSYAWKDRPLAPWEVAPMCLEMEVWCTAGIRPPVDDDDYRKAAYIRMRHPVGKRYVERVFTERVPAGLVEETARAYQEAHVALARLKGDE